ncbi:hypothetical protein GCM10023175_15390 [Pseudonocardia xishanensis]|uniref:Transposase IS116/IS110/IS902 family protein n=1 Tax=Pseudonocardia xishanensis TaxID=630995 RepID=A0ABP8RKR0_9PSEU
MLAVVRHTNATAATAVSAVIGPSTHWTQVIGRTSPSNSRQKARLLVGSTPNGLAAVRDLVAWPENKALNERSAL